MAGIVGLITFLSSDVSMRLAAAGYPPLVDGRILLGRQHVEEQSAPPRIVFVPMGSSYGPKDAVGNPTPARAAERRAQIAQRSRMTDLQRFEIHCWGVTAAAPDPDFDFDATQFLVHTLIGSIQDNIRGTYTMIGGTWADQQPGAAQLQKLGHDFVLTIDIQTPVLDAFWPLVTVSSFQGTVEFLGNTTSAETVIVLVP